MCALKEDLYQRRMPVERRRNPDFHVPVGLGKPFHNGWQVALQVNPQRQEVWDHQDAGDAAFRQMRHGLGQARPGFQERGFHAFERSGGGHRFRHGPHGIVGGWDAGSVCKDDNSTTHSYYEHSNIC